MTVMAYMIVRGPTLAVNNFSRWPESQSQSNRNETQTVAIIVDIGQQEW